MHFRLDFFMEAINMNPDQTAPKGADWSGSIWFALLATLEHTQTRRADDKSRGSVAGKWLRSPHLSQAKGTKFTSFHTCVWRSIHVYGTTGLSTLGLWGWDLPWMCTIFIMHVNSVHNGCYGCVTWLLHIWCFGNDTCYNMKNRQTSHHSAVSII